MNREEFESASGETVVAVKTSIGLLHVTMMSSEEAAEYELASKGDNTDTKVYMNRKANMIRCTLCDAEGNLFYAGVPEAEALGAIFQKPTGVQTLLAGEAAKLNGYAPDSSEEAAKN